jgi:cobalamin synthase
MITRLDPRIMLKFAFYFFPGDRAASKLRGLNGDTYGSIFAQTLALLNKFDQKVLKFS